jgi:hypothetical protein
MKPVATLMDSARKYLSWIFALAFFIGVPITFTTTANIFSSMRHRDTSVHLSVAWWLLLFVLPWVMPLQTAVFGLAWWTVFRSKRSARIWGIAASLVFVCWTLLPLVIPPHTFWKGELLLLGTGIVGLTAFAWPGHPTDVVYDAQKNWKLPGDGTSSLFNKALQLVTLLVFWRAYHWWMEWLTNNDLASPDFITGTLMLALIGLLIVFLHESGHTLVGLLLGMKLRAFIVGPFQWRIRDGKWEFHFEPRHILATSGATGVVPTTVNSPRSLQLCMLIAGILTNTATGIFALAFSVLGLAYMQPRGPLALFGVFSIVAAAVNILPFRIADSYSDGAQIYQLFSKGPWGDYHRVMGLAGSGLVSPIRPRDYDINAIHHAAQSIAQGRQGLLLRLLAYSYFLDCADLDKAGDELAQAGTIYNESASDAPVEFVTDFVFGSAYIWRNADSARKWWAHVEAKKPARLNSDYWLAHAALRWVEGDVNAASESLEKARSLAQKLPAFGAYDFERYRCTLLGKALGAAAAAT